MQQHEPTETEYLDAILAVEKIGEIIAEFSRTTSQWTDFRDNLFDRLAEIVAEHRTGCDTFNRIDRIITAITTGDMEGK
jgi:cysteine sulfinate desulfinase/cysteine desulfurase-like protein